MEPVSAFATIVGLLATFKNERKIKSDNEYKEFIEWLNEHQHREIIDLLELNTNTTISIKALLNQDREMLLGKLESIDQMLASISSQIDGFGDLAQSLKPGFELSEQALSILRQIEEAQASAFLVMKVMGGQIMMLLIDGNGSQIEYNEPRFLEDDYETMVSLGLLLQDFNSKGEPVYRITRQASKLVQLVGAK